MSSTVTPHRHTRQPTTDRRTTVTAILIFIVATLTRLPLINSKPGWEWDESSYTNIGRSWAENGVVQSATEYGHQAVDFLYHPPLYFMFLGTWFEAVGVGVTQARILGVITSLIGIVLLYALTKRVAGNTTALVLFAFLAIDPWTVYANRTSWMENSLLVLIVGAVALYWRAIQRNTTGAFVLAGIGVGAAAVYKHTGAYLLLVVAIHYLITRSELKKHLALVAGALGTVATYLLTMTAIYGEYYWDITLHQWYRTIGMDSVNLSGNGSIKGLTGLIEPIMGQYKVFAGTLIVMAVTGLWVLFRLAQAAKLRSSHHIRINAFAFSWVVGGMASFGLVSMKFPSYLLIILVAMFFYLATELKLVFEGWTHDGLKKALMAGMVIVALLDVAGLYWRIWSKTDNAIARAGTFAEETLPADAVILTEQPFGNLVDRRFCDIRAHAAKCVEVATHVITYESANYPGPDDETVREILARSTPLREFTGFKEKITVYVINPKN